MIDVLKKEQKCIVKAAVSKIEYFLPFFFHRIKLFLAEILRMINTTSSHFFFPFNSKKNLEQCEEDGSEMALAWLHDTYDNGHMCLMILRVI